MFNSMLQLGYVPDAFGTGVIIPLIKNSDGDTGSTNNYRRITLSPILSKLFELRLRETTLTETFLLLQCFGAVGWAARRVSGL